MLSNLAIKISDFFSETDFWLFAIRNYSEKKITSHTIPKTQSQSYKKKDTYEKRKTRGCDMGWQIMQVTWGWKILGKKRLVNRFLKAKNTSFEVKIHFKTHLCALHPKIGSRYLQKKNKKRLVNRFLMEKIQVSKRNLPKNAVLNRSRST